MCRTKADSPEPPVLPSPPLVNAPLPSGAVAARQLRDESPNHLIYQHLVSENVS